MTDADLLNALRDCYDPVLRRNLVEMKLVRSARLVRDFEAPGVVPRFVAEVTLTAPSGDEGAQAQMVAQVENRLLGLEAISRVVVKLLPPLFAIL
jgi:metal-sulfur cluster biosynthetic enzyme